MGFYGTHVLPRITDVALSGREFTRMRERATAGLAGEVLEIGFGSGRNVPRYPATVRRVWAVEPAAVGRALAAKRAKAGHMPVEHVGIDGQELPLEDESVDCVLSTWTLCTIPDVDRALAEARRVLRPGGTIQFVEHGLSPDPGVSHWQDRLNPLQRRVFGGCHRNRPIDQLVIDAGFEITRLETGYARGPKPFGYMFEGVAAKARA